MTEKHINIPKKDINQLIEAARKIVEKEQTDLSSLNQLLTRELLLPFAQWREDKPYTRICLHENDEFELVLICWNPYSKTAIHNHNEQNCSVFFFDSEFEEVIYCEEGKAQLKINRIEKGGISSMNELNNCHSLQNISSSPAMSLHLYNQPIKTCKVIRVHHEESSPERAVLEYDINLSN